MCLYLETQYLQVTEAGGSSRSSAGLGRFHGRKAAVAGKRRKSRGGTCFVFLNRRRGGIERILVESRVFDREHMSGQGQDGVASG